VQRAIIDRTDIFNTEPDERQTMEVTGHYWTVAGLGGTLVVLAVVFARPVPLYGAAALAAFLVARQVWFLRALEATDDALTVDQSLPLQYIRKSEEIPVTLAADLKNPSPLELTIDFSPPLLTTVPNEPPGKITLPAGHTQAWTTIPLTWSVVGRSSFDPATVTVEDPHGLFRETLPRGSTPTVTIEPRVPRNVHVGRGGDRVRSSFGGHRSDQFGSGTDPAELREYIPGDSVSDIDWKATARLDAPHVREYEVETDRQTILFVDHRTALTTGPPGETKLDYLRAVALMAVENAAEGNDPTGVATVDEGGTTAWEPPSTSPETYSVVKSTLHDLTTDATDPSPTTGQASKDKIGTETTDRSTGPGQSPAAARQKATHLTDDDSSYGRSLRPFFTEAEGYVQRMEVDPLFGTVRTRLEETPGAVWSFLFTDDTDRAQLRETVKLASSRSAHMVVFLTPGVLFERDGLADVDAAYESYVEFEEFRRELASLDGVTALEVGPSDRIEAVLNVGRRQPR